MRNRWDETWHRLREWTNDHGPSERLAAQILLGDGYGNLDPSHPLGGPDGLKDALCQKDGKIRIMAAYFPRGQQTFGTIRKKLQDDAVGVDSNGAYGLVFVTNQEVLLAEREELRTAARVPSSRSISNGSQRSSISPQCRGSASSSSRS